MENWCVFLKLFTRMKKVILLLFVCASSISWGQGSTGRIAVPDQLPNHIERYNVDYKLVDESVLANDSTILNHINLDALEEFRLNDENVIVRDVPTNLEVVLFYRKKTTKPSKPINTSAQ